MDQQPVKKAFVNIPLTAMHCLYGNKAQRTVVCELKIDELEAVNEATTLEELFAEAELEYAAGLTKEVTNADDLIEHLKS